MFDCRCCSVGRICGTGPPRFENVLSRCEVNRRGGLLTGASRELDGWLPCNLEFGRVDSSRDSGAMGTGEGGGSEVVGDERGLGSRLSDSSSLLLSSLTRGGCLARRS